MKNRNIVASAGGALALLGQSAHAAVPTAVDAALASIGTDASEVAGVVLLAVVIVFAVKFLRRGL